MIDPENRKPSWVLILFFILSACSSTRHLTHSEKSGVEQLLVSKAIDKALQGATLNIEGSRVFVDAVSLTPEENAFIRKSVSHWLLKRRALLTRERREADAIASVLVKSAGTDGKEVKLGLPSVPVPLLGIATPELTVFGKSSQTGYAEFEIILFSPEGSLKGKTDSLVGKTYFNSYTILFIPFSTENIYQGRKDSGEHPEPAEHQ